MRVSTHVCKMSGMERWRKIYLRMMSEEEMHAILNDVRSYLREKNPSALKLYPPGRLLHIDYREKRKFGILRSKYMSDVQADDTRLRRLKFSPGWFYNRWPLNYRKNLNEVMREMKRDQVQRDSNA